MTERQNFSHSSEDEPRRVSTGMKLVLFGALVPVFLVALLVGGFLLARGQADGAAVTAVSEAQLDCSSSRDAWRWACQKTGAATPSAAAAAVGDGPSTTGSVEHKTGRSSSIKTATAEPAEPAKEPPKALPLVKAPVPPSRPAEPDKSPAGRVGRRAGARGCRESGRDEARFPAVIGARARRGSSGRAGARRRASPRRDACHRREAAGGGSRVEARGERETRTCRARVGGGSRARAADERRRRR